MSHKEKAKALFLEGYNCAQAVVGAYADEIGVPFEQAVKIASPFGGGMGRLREVCGALSGVFLVLGYLQGYSDPKDPALKLALYQKVQALAKRYAAAHGGTYVCREMLAHLGVDQSPTPSPRTESYYKERPCARLVYDACELFDAFLEEQKKAEN